jgi:hypothetical protein
LEEQCVLFKGRIDPTSKTLSKRSTYLFLGNQLRQLVKELLAGSYALSDPELDRQVKELLGTEKQYSDSLTKFVDYVNYLTSVLPVWEDISNLTTGGLEARQIPVRRAQGWVCLSATGLNLIGRVGYRLFMRNDIEWRTYAKRLADLPWERDAGIWQGNVVQNGKLLTQQAPLKRAYEAVAKAIQIPSI